MINYSVNTGDVQQLLLPVLAFVNSTYSTVVRDEAYTSSFCLIYNDKAVIKDLLRHTYIMLE